MCYQLAGMTLSKPRAGQSGSRIVRPGSDVIVAKIATMFASNGKDEGTATEIPLSQTHRRRAGGAFTCAIHAGQWQRKLAHMEFFAPDLHS